MEIYKNCVNLPMLDVDENCFVEEEVPPPVLHLLMGATNLKLEVIRQVCVSKGLEDHLWAWCSRHGVTRRGYNGKNKLDGNNSKNSTVPIECT